MKLTFQEFVKKMYKLNPDSNPDIVQDGWVYRVTEAIRLGKNVSDRVLNSHSDICFGQSGTAHYNYRRITGVR